MRIRTGVALCGLAMGLALPAQAQIFETDFPFRLMNESAWVLGIGEAGVAVQGYPNAHYLNPATLGTRRAVEAGSNFNLSARPIPLLSTDRGISPDNDAPTVAWMRNPWVSAGYGRWSVAYAYKELNFGTFDGPDPGNEPPGARAHYDASHKISVAHRITRRLSIGVGFTHIKSVVPSAAVDDGAVSAWSVDAGMRLTHRYTLPGFHIRPALGWSLTDFGQPSTHEPTGRTLILPMMLRAGISLHLSTATGRFQRPWARLGLHLNRSKLLPALDTEGEPDGAWETLFYTGWQPVEVDVGTPDNPEVVTVSGWDLLDRQKGLDLTLLEIFSLRWGRFEASPASRNISRNSWGWGLDLFYVALDYAHVEPETQATLFPERSFWNLTLRVPLGHHPNNFWPALLRSR